MERTIISQRDIDDASERDQRMLSIAHSGGNPPYDQGPDPRSLLRFAIGCATALLLLAGVAVLAWHAIDAHTHSWIEHQRTEQSVNREWSNLYELCAETDQPKQCVQELTK